MDRIIGMNCPYCGHQLADHYLFAGDYEQPAPEVWCESEEIDLKTLVSCRCNKSPRRFTAEQLAQIPT